MHRTTPLLLSTCLALGLLAARLELSGQWTFAFLGWNLLLAWIPYVSSVAVEHLDRRRAAPWITGLFGLVWLVFFPNAPYLVTDLLHLEARPPVPLWYDVGLLAAFAWTGLFLAVFSLDKICRVVESHLGAAVSWTLVATTTVLGGLGIYLGRFLRWNSWDLLFQPLAVLSDVAARVGAPLEHPRTFGVTLMFGALVFVCYLTIRLSTRRQALR